MNITHLIVFSITPSLIWLIFFLREDKEPEPKKTISKVFFAGATSALILFLLSLILRKTHLLLGLLIISPIIEEVTKYLVVKHLVLKSSSLDEPTDMMIYLITSAMGFSAVENLIFLFPERLSLLMGNELLIKSFMLKSVVRFVSGTFLHALASGILGYFLVLSARETKKSYIYIGLLVSTALHALHNFSIITIESGKLQSTSLPILLLSMLVALLVLFSKARKMPSVCLLKNKRYE